MNSLKMFNEKLCVLIRSIQCLALTMPAHSLINSKIKNSKGVYEYLKSEFRLALKTD